MGSRARRCSGQRMLAPLPHAQPLRISGVLKLSPCATATEATKRGLGAALLRSPRKLARLVAGIAAGSPLPLTVKVRTGTSAAKVNVAETVAALHAAGAAAVTVHGRTAEQRYKRPADWRAVAAVAAAGSGFVIGNGDLLTHYEVSHCRPFSDNNMSGQASIRLHPSSVTGAQPTGAP